MEVIIATADIDKFIRNLAQPTKGKVMRLIDALEKHGHDIGMPYSKSLSDGLFELRVTGKMQVRLFYCFYKGNACILHIFIKKTDKIPPREFALAKRRRGLLI